MQVSISVDDGCRDDVKIARLCKQLKIEAVFYVPVDFITLGMLKGWEPMSPSDESYIANNFEIGSHGVTHAYLTQIGSMEATDEIFDSKDMLRKKYGQNITKFCYPRGYANEKIKALVREAGYTYARSTAIGQLGEPEDQYFAGSAVHMGCPVRPEYAGTTWLDYGLKMLKQARAEDKDFHAWCHGWEITKYNEWGNIMTFFKELAK